MNHTQALKTDRFKQREIAQENEHLIKRILEIERSNNSVKNKSNKKSLNFSYRKNQYVQIQKENLQMLKRIQEAKSTMKGQKIQKHCQRQKQLKKLIQKDFNLPSLISNSRLMTSISYTTKNAALSATRPPHGTSVMSQHAWNKRGISQGGLMDRSLYGKSQRNWRKPKLDPIPGAKTRISARSGKSKQPKSQLERDHYSHSQHITSREEEVQA